MPAARARSRPGACAVLEMTTAISASSRCSAIASISAWRLLPRPEMRTPMRREPGIRDAGSGWLAGNVSDTAIAGNYPSDARRAGAELHDELIGRPVLARDDQADAHVERAHHVLVMDIPRALKTLENGGHAP